MKIVTLEELLVDELREIYSAEMQMIKTLPRLAEAALSEDLSQALQDHLQHTRHHAERLEQIAVLLNIKPTGKKCSGMEVLLQESRDLLSAHLETDLLDAALIGAMQRAEHFEIAAYGTARAHARQLGLLNIADLLGRSLAEERGADQRLTSLAENRVNVQAAMAELVTS